jgi:DNA-binding NtrC family response regulator
MITKDCKRLAEVDFPIAEVSRRLSVNARIGSELREALVEQLALHEEFESIAVDNGTKGVQTAKAGQIDLVIMDVGLPDVDGREAVRILRKNGFKAPIIMIARPICIRYIQLRVRAVSGGDWNFWLLPSHCDQSSSSMRLRTLVPVRTENLIRVMARGILA